MRVRAAPSPPSSGEHGEGFPNPFEAGRSARMAVRSGCSPPCGKVGEWLMPSVWKAGTPQGVLGSNPSLSAKFEKLGLSDLKVGTDPRCMWRPCKGGQWQSGQRPSEVPKWRNTADAHGSGPCALRGVQVRCLSSAPKFDVRPWRNTADAQGRGPCASNGVQVRCLSVAPSSESTAEWSATGFELRGLSAMAEAFDSSTLRQVCMGGRIRLAALVCKTSCPRAVRVRISPHAPVRKSARADSCQRGGIGRRGRFKTGCPRGVRVQVPPLAPTLRARWQWRTRWS